MSQETDFLKAVISTSLLDDAIDWIKVNLDPADVFSDEVLAEWAKEQDDPGIVFAYEQLAAWALDNDFAQLADEKE